MVKVFHSESGRSLPRPTNEHFLGTATKPNAQNQNDQRKRRTPKGKQNTRRRSEQPSQRPKHNQRKRAPQQEQEATAQTKQRRAKRPERALLSQQSLLRKPGRFASATRLPASQTAQQEKGNENPNRHGKNPEQTTTIIAQKSDKNKPKPRHSKKHSSNDKPPKRSEHPHPSSLSFSLLSPRSPRSPAD